MQGSTCTILDNFSRSFRLRPLPACSSDRMPMMTFTYLPAASEERECDVRRRCEATHSLPKASLRAASLAPTISPNSGYLQSRKSPCAAVGATAKSYSRSSGRVANRSGSVRLRNVKHREIKVRMRDSVLRRRRHCIHHDDKVGLQRATDEGEGLRGAVFAVMRRGTGSGGEISQKCAVQQ